MEEVTVEGITEADITMITPGMAVVTIRATRFTRTVIADTAPTATAATATATTIHSRSAFNRGLP